MLSLTRFVLLSSLSLLPAAAQFTDGPGKAETVRLCSQCHELERAASLRMDTDGWQGEASKMSALGMKATDAEIQVVVAYLAKTFPAEAQQKLNVNKASAIELESALSLRRSQSAAIIEYRTRNGPFKSLDDLKKVPGLDPVKLDAKKDRLTFQ